MAREPPILPLPLVLFPAASLPLHVFEPRDRGGSHIVLTGERRSEPTEWIDRGPSHRVGLAREFEDAPEAVEPAAIHGLSRGSERSGRPLVVEVPS